MDRLHRTRLLFGDVAVDKLHNATVMVVGCGAVGSFAIEALARTGVGNIIILDSDNVALSNINRQLIALGSTIGRPKVDVATERVLDINPEIRVTALNMFLNENNMPNIYPDLVIDAIDTVASKIALYKWCDTHNIPFVSSMGAARKTDVTKIKMSKISKTTVCPLAAKIRKTVRQECIRDFDVVYSTEPAAPTTTTGHVFGSLITVTGIFGLMLANWAIHHIISQNTNAATQTRSNT